MTIRFNSAAGNDAFGPEGPYCGGIDVAVVAVSDRNRRAGGLGGRSRWAAMEDYTTLLSEHTTLRALPIPLTCGWRTVATRITELPERVVAVFLIGLNPLESAAVQAIAAATGRSVVVSETDALTAAVAAAAVNMLRGAGIGPGQGRLMVLGAEKAPKLERVLVSCGAGQVTVYQERDCPGPALRRWMADHDVLVDLADIGPAWTVSARTVSVSGDPFDFAALAVAGLLSALCGHGAVTMTVDAVAAAARAIALITPTDRILPELHAPRLVPVVARHVGATLAVRAQNPPAHP